MKFPDHLELIVPTIKALKKLGGTATIEKITKKVIELESYSEKIKNEPQKGEKQRTKLEYRLAWTRTYMKKFLNAIESRSRSVWSLTQEGFNLDISNPKNIIDIVKKNKRKFLKISKPKKLKKNKTKNNNEDEIDSYLRFLKKFKIKEEEFIKYGLDSIIFAPLNKATAEWYKLKKKVFNNEEVSIRGFGRDGANTEILKDIHKDLFKNFKIKRDPSNNLAAINTIKKLTGYYVKPSKLYKEIKNYQTSHIFGHTKNALTFTAPWNIIYMPKIFDPFTGHESKGNITKKFKEELKKKTYEKFKILIDDYNKIVDSDNFKDKLKNALKKLKENKNKYPSWKKKDLLKDVESEFQKIIL